MFPFNFLTNIITNKLKDMQQFAEEETRKEASSLEEDKPKQDDSYVLVNGEKIVVPFKVVQKPLPKNCFSKSKKSRKPNVCVTHWDVALSAESCYRILEKGKISTHFCIDNDGTIYQFVDTNDIAWHAGPTSIDKQLLAKRGMKNIPSWNNNSIGIDFSNAYYVKYQKNYEKMGYGPRPILSDKINNVRIGPFLGFYSQQIEAYKNLCKFLSDFYSIPLEVPSELKSISRDVIYGKFSGFINHYNLTPNKIDCAGLEMDTIFQELKLRP
jgi:hypothetical protein